MEAIGFGFHSIYGRYWDEGYYYGFDAAEIDYLDDVTAELHAMCLQAVQHVIDRERFDELAIPPGFRPAVVKSWTRGEPSLYGRFDFCYDGRQPPKLLEYNADTPTSLLESSVAQWYWLMDIDATLDQFNSIHEKLIERWASLRRTQALPLHLHFACAHDSGEDFQTVEYLRDTAIQAGFTTFHVFMEDIGWDGERRVFVDLEGRRIHALFKLYPWEWLAREEFGPYLLADSLQLLEPCWKMLLSNKAILPILWELFPGHPNLLPSYFHPEPLGGHYVKKPIFSREGANVSLVSANGVVSEPGGYGAEGWIYQAYAPLPTFDGENYVVLGSWIVGDRPAGIGIREDASRITKDSSRFLPHLFMPGT